MGFGLEQNGPEIAITEPDQEAAERLRQASVEDAPDDTDSMQRRLAQQSSLDESLHPSRLASPVPARPGVPRLPSATSLRDAASAPSSGMPSPAMFPTTMMDIDDRMRQRPSNLASGVTPDLPAAPSDFASPASSVAGTPSHLGAPPEAFPPVSTFQSFPPPHPAALPPQAALEPVGSPLGSPQSQTPARPLPPHDYGKSTHPPPTTVKPTSAPRPTPRSTAPPTSSITAAMRQAGSEVDEETIAQAQKHARWAVSALNFDDVNTAVKELRNALASLGAQ